MSLELAYMSLSYLLYSPIKSVNCIRQFKALPTRRVIRQGTNTIHICLPRDQFTCCEEEGGPQPASALSFSLSRYDAVENVGVSIYMLVLD